MYYIDTTTITEDHILAGTSITAEDPTPAWTAGTYAVGDERHVVATHRVYRCAVDGASSTSPELDATRWTDMRPTNRWAPFDWYTDTAAESSTDDISYVLAGRFVNALALYGLAGNGIVVSIKDQVGGTVIYRYPATGAALLRQPARGYWDYAYGQRRPLTSLVLRDLPIRAAAEITITVSAGTGQRRAIGMIAMGKFRSLGGPGLAGVLEDAEVTPKTYTYREVQADGRQRIRPRGSSRDLRYQIMLDRRYADLAVSAIDELQSRPVPWIVSTKPGFAALGAFGILTRAPVRYRNSLASIDVSIEGFV